MGTYPSQIILLAAILGILANDAYTPVAGEIISRWFWCGVLGERYGAQPHSRFAADLPELVAMVRGENGRYVFPRKWCKAHKLPTELVNSAINKTPLSSTINKTISDRSPSEYIDLPDMMMHAEQVLESHAIGIEHLRNGDFDGFLREIATSPTYSLGANGFTPPRQWRHDCTRCVSPGRSCRSSTCLSGTLRPLFDLLEDWHEVLDELGWVFLHREMSDVTHYCMRRTGNRFLRDLTVGDRS